MTRERGIAVYIFKETDDLPRQERLLRAAEHYCGSTGIGCADADASVIDRTLLKVEKTPLGKPYFPESPNLHFSISHSGAYWVCAFAPAEVGVDIQEHTLNRSETRQEATVRFAKMARRFFHPVEAQYVEAESFYRFFGVWAARESYVKYTGQGIDASFSEHCVIPQEEKRWPELMPRIPVKNVSDVTVEMSGGESKQAVNWYAQGVWFWETLYREDYTLCVCTDKEEPCRVISCFENFEIE